ncbi:MAG: response regulator [Arcobacter sp.]|nr:response regulator [Arcobacter sp.]|tara:strand:- start:4643 stop:5032 length:390 start_codon:yes stop_codon:yes gene_type:complete
MHEKIEKLRSLKLLFVEDEEDLLSIISDALTKLEANFLTASNGLEALEVLKNNPDIDAIVTDINMPLMNGLDMIENIISQDINIPIIIMSAHTETEYISKAKEYGVSEYLLKPFDFIKFIELITSMEIK